MNFPHVQLCLFFLLYWPLSLAGQEPTVLYGIVKDSKGDPIPQVTLRLIDSLRGPAFSFAISRPDGSFHINFDKKGRAAVILVAEHVQFSRQEQGMALAPGQATVGPIHLVLLPGVKALQEVVIRSEPPKFAIKGDTVEFRASAYRNGESRKVEDLLRNIQGFEVGSNGQISFNGKEVDRILLEGEDLTEQQYQLLSRNLSASIVEKVQVIQRYDPNRLSAGISGSDKVGINLRIDPKTWKKWTGSLELGVGNDDRRLADLNLVRLAKSFKLICFLQHNTIGIAANADMHYLFSAEGRKSTGSAYAAGEQGLIQAGRIGPPPLGDSYTRDNQDYSGFSIGSWKIGATTHMKLLLGAADTRLSFRSERRQEVFPPDGDGWTVYSAEHASSRDRQGILRYSLSHDAGKKNLGVHSFELLGNRNRDAYQNQTIGAITDHLTEALQTDGRFFRFSGEESFLLKPGQLLKATASWQRDKPSQYFQADTERYLEYFGLDSAYDRFTQVLPGLSDAAEVDITVMAKRKKARWSAGVRAALETTRYAAETYGKPGMGGTDTLVREGDVQLRTARITGYTQWRVPHGRQGEWLMGGVLGYGALTWTDSIGRTSAENPVYRIVAGYSRTMGPLRQFSVQVQSIRDLPDKTYFHPDGVLSGQATILNGTRELRFPASHGLTATYAVNNLQKGYNWVFIASGGVANRQYTLGQSSNPSYTILIPWVTDGNLNISLQVKGEQYIKKMRSKFKVQVSFLQLRQDLLFNSDSGLNRMGSGKFQLGWISAFKGKLNAEVSMTGTYTRNETIPGEGSEIAFSQWQYQGTVKLRARFSEKLFFTCLYQGYVLQAENYFQALDCFARWQVRPAWSISVYGHNLLQSKRIESRIFSANQKSATAFSLVGPYLMARVQWQF